MKYLFCLLFLITISTSVMGKPTIGIIEFEIKSDKVKKISNHLYKYLREKTVELVSKDYEIAPAPQMNLQDMYLMLGCSTPDISCMTSIASMMKVDFIIYGTIKSVKNRYELVLNMLDVKTAKVKRGRLIGDMVSVESMNNHIEQALYKMFGIEKKKKFIEVTLAKVDIKNTIGKVYIDGKLYGSTPLAITNKDIKPGKHNLVIKSEGYEDYKKEINLSTISPNFIQIMMKKVKIAALKKDKKDQKKLDIKKDDKLDLTKKDDQKDQKEWYQQWWFWTAVGGVAIIATGALIFMGGDDTESTPSNNVIISF